MSVCQEKNHMYKITMNTDINTIYKVSRRSKVGYETGFILKKYL